MRRTLAIISALTVLCTAAVAQNAEVRAVLDSQKILIGDQMNFDLTVFMTDRDSVVWPVLKDTITGQLEIVESSIPDTVKQDSGRMVMHQRLILTSFDTGFHVLPPIDFVFNSDTLQTLSTDPLMIFVSDMPVEMDKDIKDIKEPLSVPYNWKKWLKWGLLALLVFALIVIGILLWRKYRKKPVVATARPKPTRPAHEIALERLEALRQKKLWQNDRTKEYYIELSDIVREYLEFRFDILALEMTTYEIVSALKNLGMEKEKTVSLKRMFQMADLAKFAKYRPVANENEQNFDIAVNFVNRTLIMQLDTVDNKTEKQ